MMKLTQYSNLCYVHLLLLVSLAVGTSGTKHAVDEIYLNSYMHCGDNKSFLVNPEQGYHLMADISKNTKTTPSVRDCEIHLHTEREAGNICVSQEGIQSQISDSNAELYLNEKNSEGTIDKTLFKIAYYPDGWDKREVCSTQRIVYFRLKEITPGAGINMTKLKMSLKVLDIQSRNRTLYIDENYCDDTYLLKNSSISVFNRLPLSYSVKNKKRSVSRPCGLRFKKDASRSQQRLCFVYIPLENFSCKTEWSITISTLMNLHKKYSKFNLSCSEPRAMERQVWCGDNSTDSYSVIMKDNRTNNEEEMNIFRLVVTDHEGSEADLIRQVESQLMGAKTEVVGLGIEMFIIIGLVALLAIVVVGVLVYIFKKRRYDSVNSEPVDV